MDTTSSTATATAHRARWVRWPGERADWVRAATGTLHLLLDLPVAVAGFVATVTLGTLALGLLLLYPVGLAVLIGWVAAVRGIAWGERWRIRTLLGYGIPDPGPLPDDASWHTRLWRTVAQTATWRAAVHHLLRLPIGIATFTAVVVAWSVPVALVSWPFALIGVPVDALSVGLVAPLLAAAVLGVLLLGAVPLVVRTLTDLDAAFAGALLGPSERDRLGHRVEQLRTSRSELIDLAEQERRRIERDLHDGAGQQLVSLAMTLGMAREKLADDPERARALLDEAHAEAKHALTGLRDTVRGISPAILTDRGLGAALAAVAGRCPVPVSLVVDVPQRPDPATEGIAYYLVCEAIGNIVRHADATRAEITLTRTGDVLEVTVRDDGRGGADPARGTGLHGLAGRVAAVDGTFTVSSPEGGPTTLHAELPARVPAAPEA